MYSPFTGSPRYTQDIDIWVWMDPANAASAVTALKNFGFGGLGITTNDFVTPDVVVQLGYPPNRVDLLTSPSGVDFGECWEERFTPWRTTSRTWSWNCGTRAGERNGDGNQQVDRPAVRRHARAQRPVPT